MAASTAANTFYRIAELRELLLHPLPFYDLVQVSHVNRFSRKDVKKIIRRRFQAHLRLWIPSSDVPIIVDILNQTESAFVGFFALCLLNEDFANRIMEYCNFEPLAIVVPQFAKALWVETLRSLMYTSQPFRGYPYEGTPWMIETLLYKKKDVRTIHRI